MTKKNQAFYWLQGVIILASLVSLYKIFDLFFHNGEVSAYDISWSNSVYFANDLLRIVTPIVIFSLYRRAKYFQILMFMSIYIVVQLILHLVELFLYDAQSEILIIKLVIVGVKVGILSFLTYRVAVYNTMEKGQVS